jgi:hypothetical protein
MIGKKVKYERIKRVANSSGLKYVKGEGVVLDKIKDWIPASVHNEKNLLVDCYIIDPGEGPLVLVRCSNVTEILKE